MAYFFILPAFALWLAIAAVMLVVLHHKNSPAFHFAWHITLWSTIGFVVANALLIIVVVGLAVAMGPGPPEPAVTRDALQVIVGVGAIVGPIPASVFGWLCGAVLGILLRGRQARSTGQRG